MLSVCIRTRLSNQSHLFPVFYLPSVVVAFVCGGRGLVSVGGWALIFLLVKSGSSVLEILGSEDAVEERFDV